MQTDRYTKSMLTIIAGCLVWQCAMAAGRVVHAQAVSQATLTQMTEAAKPVVIVGWGEMNEKGEVVNVYTKRTQRGIVTDPIASVRLPESPLPVTVNGAVQLASSATRPIPVAITQISNTSGAAWDPIATKEGPAGTRKTPGEIR
jgi:hypothetical protein